MMIQNKCNTAECNTAEVVNDLVAAVDKLEAKIFKLFLELDKLKEAVEQQQALTTGPLLVFINHESEFKRLLSTGFLQSVNKEVAQNKRHIEALADEIIREKLDKALDEISDKLKDVILEKIEKQSALW